MAFGMELLQSLKASKTNPPIKMRQMYQEYRWYRGDRHYRTREEHPNVKNNDAVVVRWRGKKIPAKVEKVTNGLIEASANGKKYVCERMGGEFVASGMISVTNSRK